MINKILLGMCLITASSTFAQQGTASPYSYFGIGDQKFKGTNEIKTMGSLAVFQDSIHINTLNPASYANLQKTTLAVGFSNTTSTLNTDTAKEKTKRSSFDYFALAFPAGKLGISVGIMPYTFVGYNIANIANINNQTISNEYKGEGGINRTYLGFGYKVTPELNVGIEAAYNFGDTKNHTTKFILNDGTGFLVERGSTEVISNDYSGLSFNAAVSYSKILSNKMKFDVTATYSPETDLRNKQSGTLSSIQIGQNGNLNIIDEIKLENLSKKLVIPQKYSLGVGYGEQHKWFVGAEYTGIQNSKLNSGQSVIQNTTFEDSHRFSLGGYYTPKYNSFTSYFDKLTYRFGARYENTGLRISDESINDAAVSLGIGIPVGLNRDSSNINIGLEYGQKGTKSKGLIKENYFNISVGFSFNDTWFKKRRYE